MATPVASQGQSGLSLGNFKYPLILTAGLFLLSLTPRVQGNEVLLASFYGAVAVLLVWLAAQLWQAQREGEYFGFFVLLRPQHYIQAMVQTSVYLYWGYYWRPVYEHVWLILAQVLFAYTAITPWASDRCPSSSASTCSCGSATTGSTCNS
jgi:hypothetical protein